MAALTSLLFWAVRMTTGSRAGRRKPFQAHQGPLPASTAEPRSSDRVYVWRFGELLAGTWVPRRDVGGRRW